jgi:hypothetical protein
MKLKDINIFEIEYIENTIINVVTPEGYLYMVPNVDMTGISGQVTKSTDFSIENDILKWNNVEIDLNQEIKTGYDDRYA